MPKHPYSKRAAQEALAATKLMVGKPYIDYMVRGTDGRDVKLWSLFKDKGLEAFHPELIQNGGSYALAA